MFADAVRDAARAKTTAKRVTEHVTEYTTETVPDPTAPPPLPPVTVEIPGTPAVRGRDDSLRPAAARILRWLRGAAVGAAGAAAWWWLAGTGDPLAGAVGATVAVFCVPVLLWTVFTATVATGRWLTSSVELTPAVPARQMAVPTPVAPTPTVTRRVPREVTRQVVKQVPVDPDDAAAAANSAVRRVRYGVETAVPGVPLPREVSRIGVGAVAEEAVGQMLETRLPAGWEVTHDLDVLRPGRDVARGYTESDVSANIDHLVSGPAGLVMVDTKSWAGTLGLRGEKLFRKDNPKWTGKRGTAVTTLLYEAGAVDGGTGVCLVDQVVIAVADGSVDGGVIEVPWPDWAGEDLPHVPVTAVEASALVGFLEGLPAVEGAAVDLAQVVEASPRLGW